MTNKKPEQPVKSPCVNVCFLDDNDVCLGCYRTGMEISRWGAMTRDQQLAVMEKVRQRESQSAFVS